MMLGSRLPGGDSMKNVFVLVLLVGLLASPGLAQDQVAAARAAAGCGPDKVRFDVTTDKKQHPEAKAEAGKAAVYVFEEERRDPNELRFGIADTATIRIGVDGQWVGADHGKSYFFFSVDPGSHDLCANWQSSLKSLSKLASAASLTAEAGKVYCFRAIVEERTQTPPGVRIEAVDPAEGQLLRAGSALSSSHPKK
jgi:hypothetical protein